MDDVLGWLPYLGPMTILYIVVRLLYYWRLYLRDNNELPALQTVLLVICIILGLFALPVLLAFELINQLYDKRLYDRVEHEAFNRGLELGEKLEKDKVDKIESEGYKRGYKNGEDSGYRRGYKVGEESGYLHGLDEGERIGTITAEAEFDEGYKQGQLDAARML